MRKLALFVAFLAILTAVGCNEEHIYMPDPDTDGRVIGTIHGTVTDASNRFLLLGHDSILTSTRKPRTATQKTAPVARKFPGG